MTPSLRRRSSCLLQEGCQENCGSGPCQGQARGRERGVKARPPPSKSPTGPLQETPARESNYHFFLSPPWCCNSSFWAPHVVLLSPQLCWPQGPVPRVETGGEQEWKLESEGWRRVVV